MNEYVQSLPRRRSPVTMLTQAHGKASGSPRNSHQPDFALESSGNVNRPESTFVPVTTSSSRHPSISPPAQDFALPPTLPQTSHDFSLPVRGRHEPHIETRRGTVAAFGNSFGAASHLATPESGSWYSQEGYQQAVAHFQARRSRSQPPRPGPGTSYSQQQQQQQQQPPLPPFEAPVSMRYVKCSVEPSLLLRRTKRLRPHSTISFVAFRTIRRFFLLFNLLA